MKMTKEQIDKVKRLTLRGITKECIDSKIEINTLEAKIKFNNHLHDVKATAKVIRDEMEYLLSRIEQYEKEGNELMLNPLGEIQAKGYQLDVAIGQLTTWQEILEGEKCQ